MNIKAPIVILISFLMINSAADAQYMRRPGGRYRVPRQRPSQHFQKFEPKVSLSFGYGFPNLDKEYFPDYYGLYRGNISQTGPITGSIDYQFSRNMAIGVLVTHGTVSAPYYDNAFPNSQAFTAKLDNWSIMFNMIRYLPGSEKVNPYIRTAIGINSWKQEYTDPNGNKPSVEPLNLSDLAYQVGIGAKFKLSNNAGLFIEGGYGKYILHGGLSFSF